MAGALLPDTEQPYSYADFLTWDEDMRCELLDGEVVTLAAPSTVHQKVVGELFFQIQSYLRENALDCSVFVAPFNVCLAVADATDELIDTVVEPDISLICDASKLDERGCKGAPDWIIEVLSPSTASRDLVRKLRLYARYGVREYWAVHPSEHWVMIWRLQDDGTYTAADVHETFGESAVTVLAGLRIQWDGLFERSGVKEPPGRYFAGG